MDWGKPFKLLEGYTDKMTSCEKVHHIKMFDSMPGYSHPVMNIRVGDCVFWTNIGEQQHTVTSTKEITGMNPDYDFNSGIIPVRGTFGIKFFKTGVYPYYCTEHKGWMRGKIIVE